MNTKTEVNETSSAEGQSLFTARLGGFNLKRIAEMAMTDKQVDDMCRKLAISFGVATTDDLVKEMVNRFLCWKLPMDFCPDCGIRFDPEYNVVYMAKQGLPPSRHEPLGTNLFHAGQAEEMVRHMLGLPNLTTEQSS